MDQPNGKLITRTSHGQTNTVTAGDIIGGYEIQELKGRGRFASVWSAIKPEGNPVAIKVYKNGSDNERYYQNEVKILSNIKNIAGSSDKKNKLITFLNTNIHINYCADLTPNLHPYLVFELQQSSASDLVKYNIKNFHITPPAVVKKILKDVFKGLKYLHSVGIIHTDIKPGNILLNQFPPTINAENISAVLGDLGSAMFADNIHTHTVGTVQYNSPEVFIDMPVLPASDIWSACVTGYELFTNILPFDVYNECSVLYGGDIEQIESANMSQSNVTADTDSGDEEDDYDDNYRMLLIMDKVIGPPPKKFTKNARLYYNARGKLKNNPKITNIGLLKLTTDNTELQKEFCRQMTQFIMRGLQYTPVNRATASEFLTDKWLLS